MRTASCKLKNTTQYTGSCRRTNEGCCCWSWHVIVCKQQDAQWRLSEIIAIFSTQERTKFADKLCTVQVLFCALTVRTGFSRSFNFGWHFWRCIQLGTRKKKVQLPSSTRIQRMCWVHLMANWTYLPSVSIRTVWFKCERGSNWATAVLCGTCVR